MSEQVKPAFETVSTSRSILVIAVFTAAIFLSATLLFAVQPMFTKLVLPRFGGSPSVWSVAMVFFQGVLLVGYAYADFLTRLVRGRWALVIHLGVMLGGALFVPLSVANGWELPPADREELFLLGMFAVSLGFPFFALSANGPLLQAWFARSGLAQASNPYFLYAASNIGSLLALFAYPLLAEPLSTLSFQNAAWRYGYYLLIVLIALCGSLVFFNRAYGDPVSHTQATEAPPTPRRMIYWVTLAFVPSALMIAVTTHITTDIAAAPFLWVLPLSLYLISFILVFSQRTYIAQATWMKAQPALLALIVLTLALDIRTWLTIDVGLHLLTFFVTAMICHGMVAASRPQAFYLTRFYFCMSLGGVLGGIFSGLIAPKMFSWIAEYPILIVAAALVRPGPWPRAREVRLVLGFIVLVLLASAPGFRDGFTILPLANWIVWAAVLVLVAGAVVSSSSSLRLAALFAAAFIVTRAYPPNVRHLETVRSFFGVHKIEVTEDGRFRALRHGMELHGAQRLTTDDGKPVTGRPVPSTYFHPASPIAEAINAVQDMKQGPTRIAVIGLGAGSIACLAKPQDRLDYYEIDADVIRIARDPARFTFLRDCKPDTQITLGDARLTLANAADARYDLIIVDAFSSDSIPVHLLTREAFRIYLSRLNPDGIIMTHISNNHLDLSGVVAATAASEGLLARIYDEDEKPNLDPMIKFSTVMVLGRTEKDLGPLRDWDVEKSAPGQAPWSDDFSSLLGPMLARMKADSE